MSNDYYDHGSVPQTGSPNSSAAIRAEFDAVEAGFDKMPTITGGAGRPVFVNSGGTALEATALATAKSRLSLPLSVKDYGAALDGSTDDTAAWIAAVAAAASAGGAIITAPPGTTSKTTAEILVEDSDIQFYLPNFTFKPSGSSSFSVLKFDSGGGLATPVLGSNAAAQATSISLSSLGGLAAGSVLAMKKAAPTNGGAADDYVFITKVRSVSGSGPYTVVLNDPLPVAFNTADSGLALSRLGVLENAGVIGKVTIDASSWTGTTQIGVEAKYCVNSCFDGVHGYEVNNGAAFYAWWGYGNTFANLTAEQCGNASYNAVMLIGQTCGAFKDHRSLHASGFGLGYHSAVYCNGSGFTADGSNTGRGVKFQAALGNNFSGITANWNTGANGVAIAIGSCNNNFSIIQANGNPTNEGVWLSDQYNCNNHFFGVQALGNTSRDIFVGDTDTGNVFFGVRTSVLPYIGGTNATTLWFGLNGEFLYFGNTSNNPVPFLSHQTAGIGASPWFGLASGDLWINNKTGQNITLAINNVQKANVTASGLFSQGGLYQNEASALVRTQATLNNGAAAATGTLTNAPSAGNPTKWIPIIDNGTTRYIPTWT